MAVTLDPWATYGRQTDIKTLLEIMAGGFRYLRTLDGTPTLADHDVQHLSLTAADTVLTLPSITWPAFDSTAEYALGDVCSYNGKVYKCTTAIASGGETWTAAHWTEVSAGPYIPEGRIGDLVVGVSNNYAPEVEGTPTPTAAEISFDSGWDSTYKIGVIGDTSLSDIMSFEAGAKAILYFTLSPFTDNNLPVWIVTRHDLTIVTAPSANSNP